jgi:hypothetical protein
MCDEEFIHITKLNLKPDQILLVRANTYCLSEGVRDRIHTYVRNTLDAAGFDNQVLVIDKDYSLAVIGVDYEKEV